MIFGYTRVSTEDQNLERQLAVLEPVCDKIVTEKESGRSTSERPELLNLLSHLREGEIPLLPTRLIASRVIPAIYWR